MTEKITESVMFTALSNGGEAIGRVADGRVIFARGLLPEEKALISYSPSEDRYLKGELAELQIPSAKRIAPVCPHFSDCAGCAFQMMSAADQLEAKREILLDQLRRIGKISDPGWITAPVIQSPSSFGYRRILRLIPDENGRFFMPGVRRYQRVYIERCALCSEALNQLLLNLEFEADNGLLQAELREGADETVQIILRGSADRPENEIETDMDVSIVYSSPAGSYVMAGDSSLVQEMAGLRFCISEDGFFHPNPEIMASLCAQLQEYLPDGNNWGALEIRGGCGFWSKWAAQFAQRTCAISEDESDAEDFSLNLESVENAALYIGSLRDILPGLREPFELVMMQAKTGGFSHEEIAGVSALHPDTIFYDCADPAILARDAPRFNQNGYQLTRVIPYDMEPQTANINALCVYRKKSSSSDRSRKS